MNYKTIIVIAGPTAIGKTTIAIGLARHFQAEIFSADSRQVYQEMNIGTAKPTKSELMTTKHHFINSHSIHQPLSAGQYSQEIREVWQNYFLTNDIGILCGGTGFYIKAALEGLDNFPQVPENIVVKWKNIWSEEGILSLQNYLEKNDPDYYEKLDKDNHRRLLRAVQIIDYTGKPFTSFLTKGRDHVPYHIVKILLNMDRSRLYQRINDRVVKMIRDGLVEEVKSLVPFAHISALDTVGYREIFAHLRGEYDVERAVELIQRNSRRYAKRQMTWFRNQDEFTSFHPEEMHKMIAFIEKLKN